MTTATAHERHELKERLRDEMRGRWRDLLPVHEFQPGRKYPCPRCNGTDRFNLDDNFEATGAVWCRHCFADRNANPPNHADGFSSLMWWHGCDFPQAFQMVKDHLGYFDEEGPRIELSPPPEIVEVYCRQRNLPIDHLKAFGARPGRRPTKDGQEMDCIEVPMFSAPGQQCGLFDLSPYHGEVFRKGMTRKGTSNGLFLHSAGLQPGTVYIVEGVKDAAALYSYGRQAVGIQGTPGGRVRQAFQKLFTEEAGPFSVVMVPDLDRGGLTNTEKITQMVDGLPGVSSFGVARLPGTWKESNGMDVRDCIQAYGWETVRDALEKPKLSAMDERPTVYSRIDEFHQLCVDSLKSLAALGWSTNWIPEDESERVKVYHQRGQLVEVIHGNRKRLIALGFKSCNEDGELEELASGVIVRRIPSDTLAAWLGRACRFRKEVRRLNEAGELVTETFPIDVPPKVVKHLLSDRQLAWDYLPELKGVVSAPILRTDGTICQTPGYDERSKYLLVPGDYFPIPASPTLLEAQSAAGLLLDLVDEFPFESPSDRASWLAYLLTLIARPAIKEATPVWAFNANQAGSGKTLLVDLAHRIAFGRTVPIKTVDPETPGGVAEMRNEITACVVEGLPAVLWDNVRGRIASPQFEAAVTSLVWSARLYHSNSENIKEQMRIVFAVTGNNLEIGGDSSRRWIACELLSDDERPECRQFRRSRIRAYVNENRQKYLAAALTILRYRWSVGTMEGGSLQSILPPVGSFEEWSAVVRDSVYLATDLDPWSTNEKVRAFDADQDTLDLILETLKGKEWTSAEIVDQAKLDGGGYVSQMLDAIGCGANPTAHKVGKRFRPFLRRSRNGWRLIFNKGSKGLFRWSVVPVRPSLPLEATAESPPDERKPPF